MDDFDGWVASAQQWVCGGAGECHSTFGYTEEELRSEVIELD